MESIAGDGIKGDRNGDGIHAQFNAPRGITINSRSELFVADEYMIRNIECTNQTDEHRNRRRLT